MEIGKDQIEDSVAFSNFAQRVKREYWGTRGENSVRVPESKLDEILLLAWEHRPRADVT